MVNLETFPTQETLQKYEKATPDYMRPNQIPFAVIAEGLVPPEECDRIVERLNQFEGYHHEKCGAFTREIVHVSELDGIRDFAFLINNTFWQYDLDPDSYTWMQTYDVGGTYQLHMDAGPGRMRKLTAVTFLTDPDDYDGGDLEVYFHPTSKMIPRTRGTVVMFQPWILHQVFEVTRGQRQSLNMSFWGPNFK